MRGNTFGKVLGVALIFLMMASTFGALSGTANAAKFSIGDTVEVTTNLNVRTGPGTGYPEITDSDYPGYAPQGTVGEVLSGPSSADGYIWWEVDFGPGSYSGWSVEGGLEKISQPSSPEPPSPPRPTSPGSTSSPGPEIDDLTPRLRWDGVSDADYYALAISRYPYGSSYIVYNPQQLTGTSHTVPSGVLEAGEKYRWNMQAHNDAGWSAVSRTLYFQISPPVTDVTLTLYVHDGSSSGPVLSGVRVTGQDSDGHSFDETTNSNGYVTITGAPGTWSFTASKSGYETNSWSQSITSSTTKHAYLEEEPVSPPSPPRPTSPGSTSSPGPEIDDLTPRLRWDGVSDADYYALAISRYPYGSSYIVYNPQQLTGTSHTVPSGVLEPGQKYRWNMQAHNSAGWSAVSSTLYFQTYTQVQIPTVDTRSATNIAETAATLNGRVISDGGSSIVERRFDWGTTSSCSDGWTASVSVSGSDFSYRLTGLNPGTTYYFRAWARNSASWSQGSVLSFTTQSVQKSNSPTPTSPGSTSEAGPEIDDLTPRLRWDGVSDADYYALAISKYPYGSSNIIYNPQQLTGTSHTVPSGVLEAGQKYRWNMQAHNKAGWSDVSSTLYFQISGPVQVPTVETRSATSVTGTAATLNGRIIDDSGSSITERRFDWGTTSSCSDGWTASVSVSGSDFSYHLTGLNPGITYYFRAWAENSAGWSDISSTLYFQTEEGVLPPPSLSSPSNYATNVSTTPTFSWSAVSGASSYRILVGTSYSGLPTDPTASTGSGLVINTTTYSTSYTPSSGVLSEGTTYYWEVHARSSTRYGEWSSKWRFTTEEGVPSAPTPTWLGSSSSPGPTIDTLTPTLQWSGVSNADYYALAISKYPYGSSNIVYNPQQLYGTSHTVPSGKLEYGQKYRWNMQAHNSAGWSDISSTLYFQTTGVQEPDLVIEGITWSPTSPSIGDAVTFTVTIKNQGTGKAGSSKVYYFIDDAQHGYDYVNSIEPGATTTETFTWKAQADSHTIEAVADYREEVAESDETNNEKTVTFSTTALSDLFIEAITWSPASPSIGDTVTFTITIKNQGTGKAGSSKVYYFIDDAQHGYDYVSSIDPGATATETFTWEAQDGPHTIKTVADYKEDIAESDETNNEKTITFRAGEEVETVSNPNTPSGPTQGVIDTSYTYSTGGASSNLGHPIEYRFDWGDGSYSGWSSSTTASYAWTIEGTYIVRSQARCATHTDVLSGWSSGLTANITQALPTSVPCPDFDCQTCYSTREEAVSHVPAHVIPRDCFVWDDEPPDYPWRVIPGQGCELGTGCAHWVAHQLGIKGPPDARCYDGYAIRVDDVIAGRVEAGIESCKVGDIWTRMRHCGIVREVGDGGVWVEHDSSEEGGVVMSWFSTGKCWSESLAPEAEAFPGASAATLSEYYSAWSKELPTLGERAKIYEALGLGSAATYSGTAEQNAELLNALKQRQICPSTGEEIGWVEPPTGEDVSRLRDIINRRLQQRVEYDPYMLDTYSFSSAVTTVWGEITDFITRQDLTDKYEEFYWTGIDYDCLSHRALIMARDSLNKGDITAAEKYLERSENYRKLSNMSFQAAIEVFNDNLDAAETIAQGIRKGCQASVVLGLKAVNPTAAEVVDYIYLAVDYAVDCELVGEKEALKNLTIALLVDGIFEYVEFEELGGRTPSDWSKNRVGKYLFPTLEKIFKNEKWQWALSKLIKEAAVDIEKTATEETLNLILDEGKAMVNLEAVALESPGELRVYDSKKQVTGLVNGMVKTEIPRSVYHNGNVTIFFPVGANSYEVVGTSEGNYGLEITSLEQGESNTVRLTDISTTAKVVHVYTIDWDALSKGEKCVTMKIDSDADGNFERVINLAGIEDQKQGLPSWAWGAIGAAIALLAAFVIRPRIAKRRHYSV